MILFPVKGFVITLSPLPSVTAIVASVFKLSTGHLTTEALQTTLSRVVASPASAGPVGINFQVVSGILMTTSAMCSLRSGGPSPTIVFRSRHWLEMSDKDASAITAEMIEDQVLWNCSEGMLVDPPVSAKVLRPDLESAVSVRLDFPAPKKAAS
jgi:hypothetical protein